ncbi:alpha/beta hydrolase [Aspergillus ibericus CBS 121593]|uniref:Alpha/beta-hydrolase n=1 Tax=Aspergillus ibericus CBS 121593 TaxID=1448316 RepID=A0A395H615_9EURO|nr:alpha/beta-hydrolase [Aspergillus ibericus CBS 121593]RAL03331.1 alpha/beta-hydrolase [Aspergillus ibericus CBS 121593]
MANRPHIKHTHVYTTHQATDLYIDVYLPQLTESETPKPIILWLHGGYLITGTRNAIPTWLLNYALAQQWPLVSPDYRVLPESTGLDTIEDVLSAYKWVVQSLNQLHPECRAEPSRIIVAGASAGGWCALVSALHFSTSVETIPPPCALFLLYPMTDPGSEKWAQSVSLPGATVDPDTARDLLEDIPRRIARGDISVGEEFPKAEEELRTRKRLPLLYAILEKGVFLDYLTGVARFGQSVVSGGLERLVDERAKRLFPLDFGEFGSSFPPTVVVHGTADGEISCGESEKLVKRLAEGGVGVQYLPVPGADHVFDLELQECRVAEGGSDEPSAVLSRALQALRRHTDAY